LLLIKRRACLQATPYQDRIPAVGLSSTEIGNPNIGYKDVYAAAIDAGFIPVAHAGMLIFVQQLLKRSRLLACL